MMVLLALLGDAQQARANMDLFNNSGINLIKIASRREELAAALGAVAAQWADDFWLSAPDRMMAVRLQQAWRACWRRRRACRLWCASGWKRR